MTPWEVQDQLSFVLEGALPHPALGMVHQLAGHFHRHWRSLWAMHGDAGGGHADYAEALKLFADELARIGEGVKLENGTGLIKAMNSLIIAVAINDADAEMLADERSAPVAAAM